MRFFQITQYPLGDLNPCYRHEKPASWARLDEGGIFRPMGNILTLYSHRSTTRLDTIIIRHRRNAAPARFGTITIRHIMYDAIAILHRRNAAYSYLRSYDMITSSSHFSQRAARIDYQMRIVGNHLPVIRIMVCRNYNTIIFTERLTGQFDT